MPDARRDLVNSSPGVPQERASYVGAARSGKSQDLLIRVYGDSLAMPRATDGISYRETYPELLQAAIHDRFPGSLVSLYNRSGGGLTIESLHDRYLQDCTYFGLTTNQILVIQCGVVDCAPRPIPAFLRLLISKLPGPVRAPVVRFLHWARPALLRAGLRWRLTSKRRFEEVLIRWLKHAATHFARTYVVNIAPTVPAIAAHSPGFESSIIAYNALIMRAVKASGSAVLIEINAAIEKAGSVSSCVSVDGHHITHAGHRLYADLILALEHARLRSGGATTSRKSPSEQNGG